MRTSDQRVMHRLGWALGILLGAVSARAESATSPPNVRASVEFAGPPGCGTREQLIDGIRRRSERIRIVPSGSAERRLSIELSRVDEELTATLAVTLAGGRRSMRTLRAASCDEALEAVALVAAVSLDPGASTAPARELPEAAPQEEPAAEPVTRPVPSQTAREDVPRPAPREPSSASASVALSAQLLSAAAPGVVPGFGAVASFELDTHGPWSPAVRLGFTHFARGGFAPDAGLGRASFVLDVAALDLCPLRAGSWALEVRPCATVSGGRLSATGSGALENRSAARPWWLAGGSLLAFVRPVRFLELQAHALLGKPLIRDTFQFAPGAEEHVVHRVAPWALGAGFAAGVAFR